MDERKMTGEPRVENVDQTFDPWEPSRPIPWLLIAVVIALAIWGTFSYLNDLAPKRVVQRAAIPEAAAPSPSSTSAVGAPTLVTSGTSDIWGCASCHGNSGQGASVTPRLAGLSELYIQKQLHDFAEESRSNESMYYVASKLSDEDIAMVAKYYASLPAISTPPSSSGAGIERGKELNERGDWSRDIPACATCHGQAGQGVGGVFPKIAGQQPDYIMSQLAAWKAGRRHNSPQSLMDDIASRMTNDDMWAVAQYFGSLK